MQSCIHRSFQVIVDRLARSVGKSFQVEGLQDSIMAEGAHIDLSIAREPRRIDNWIIQQRTRPCFVEGDVAGSRSMAHLAADASNQACPVIPVLIGPECELLYIRDVAFKTSRRCRPIEDGRSISVTRAVDPLPPVRPIADRKFEGRIAAPI